MGRLLIISAFIIFFCQYSWASHADSLSRQSVFEENTFIFPRAFKPFKIKTAFSVLFTRLPMDWVETSLDIPIFQLEAKYGLPAGFSIKSSVQTIVVSNQIRLGPCWNVSLGKFAFGAGIDMSFLYGRMVLSGFDNEAKGWAAYPNLSVGFSTGKTAFTLSGELNNLFSMQITSGEEEISKANNFKSGYTFSLFMEQYLWKKHVMTLGLINNYQKFFYPAWPAFSAFNRRYFIIQVYIGIVL
jgi:hypothetical protein